MREIKFRAWEKELKKMSDPFGLFDIYSGRDEAEAGGVQFYQDKLEIMQYTGLKDKNGKEIFEGDITTNGIVEYQTNLSWDSGRSLHAGFYFATGGDGNLSYHHGFDECKVIGNIYENPELIKNAQP